VPLRDGQPLTPEIVLEAYRLGAFPMADEWGQILWFSPDPRAIFPLDGLKISRSLRQTLRRESFDVRINRVFDDVMAACGDRSEGTWISDEIASVYRTLHARGWAHSVEAWQDDELVGGLYGVAIGGAFFGESMFFRATDASKVALVALVERMRARRFTLLDTQWLTPHLRRLGAIEISRDEYLARLGVALAVDTSFA
jgi:leucyl/phenylalanyl-tRNA--protein transferase